MFSKSLVMLKLLDKSKWVDHGQYSCFQALNSVAWYYGDTVPVQQLSKFDIVVVAPSSNLNPATVAGPTKYFAYTSIGEVASFQSYYKVVVRNRWGRKLAV